MVYVSDLADQILDKSRAGEVLYCPACEATFSASAGDYWHLDKDQKLTCASEHGKTDLMLIVPTRGYEIVKS